MEQTNTITITTEPIQTQMAMSYLRDIEFTLLNMMYTSKTLFDEITSQLIAEDFTFIVNKKIFEYLVFLEKDFFNDKLNRTDIAFSIFDIYNISPITTLKILDGRTKHYESIHDFKEEEKEENIKADIFEILNFSKKREALVLKESEEDIYYSNISIEDEYGFYDMVYRNGVIKEIGTTYIFHLPDELCDTFQLTFENITSYIQKDDHEVNIILNDDNPDEIQAFTLRKNMA